MALRTSRVHLTPIIALLTSSVLAGCVAEPIEDDAEPVQASAQASTSPTTSSFPATYARQWMTVLVNSIKGDGTNPALAARTYTYGAIAIYESVVHGMPGYRSMAGQLNGLQSLPKPDRNKVYDWPTVLAETMHQVVNGGLYVYPLRVFFEHTTLTEAALEALGPSQIGYRQTAGIAPNVIANSIEYADRLAAALLEWIDADGYHQVRFKGWLPPEGEDKWVPTGFSDTDKVADPTEPYFGTLRPLVLKKPDECAKGLKPPKFSTRPNSEFYQQALHVYHEDQHSTPETREIARFWSDNPRETGTPSAHWIALATKNLRAKNLAEAAAGYAFTSLAYFDAFIAIWETKFRFNLIRPESYIRRYIDDGWRPFLATPQFPTYVSGHSGVSGTAGVVFTHWFGNGPVVDDTKLRRGFPVHTYANYMEAALEASHSRVYGGIHYEFDSDDGIALGRCLGEKIKARVRLR